MEIAPLKVLHTNFLRGWGGQSNRILTECIGLRDLGWDVLVSAPAESELIRRSRDAGLATDVTVRYVGGFRAGVLSDVKAMRRLLLQYQPDIIHLHGGRDSWVYAMAMFSVPAEQRPICIRTKHNIFPVSDHPLNRWQYGRCFDSIVSLSTAVTRQLMEKPYISNDKLVTIASAIDPRRFDVDPAEGLAVREALGYTADQVVIGITGRLRREKAHDVLLRAVPLVVEQCPQARFVCFGSGSLGAELGALLEDTGMTDYVHMAGFRKDVPQCLAALDIYTQPSRSEGLGTSVLEAAAAGLPIVATDCGGIPDIIKDDETGLLVPMEDPQALAAGLVRLAQDQALRERLGAAARRWVREQFNVETLVTKTDAHYRAMMSEMAAAGSSLNNKR